MNIDSICSALVVVLQIEFTGTSSGRPGETCSHLARLAMLFASFGLSIRLGTVRWQPAVLAINF